MVYWSYEHVPFHIRNLLRFLTVSGYYRKWWYINKLIIKFIIEPHVLCCIEPVQWNVAQNDLFAELKALFRGVPGGPKWATLAQSMSPGTLSIMEKRNDSGNLYWSFAGMFCDFVTPGFERTPLQLWLWWKRKWWDDTCKLPTTATAPRLPPSSDFKLESGKRKVFNSFSTTKHLSSISPVV